jgi:hypothetical protein
VRTGQTYSNTESSAELRLAKLTRDLLNESAEQLPSNIEEKLEKARNLALSRRKTSKKWVWITNLSLATGQHQSSSWSDRLLGVFGAAPILALALGIIVITNWQQDARIRDIAEVDSALLTDIVPPEAYNDDGFIHFLMTDGKEVDMSTDKPEEI